MKKTLTKILIFIFTLLVASSCNSSSGEKGLMLYLSFDEGNGNKVEDKAKKLDTATVQYVFNNPKFQPKPQDPQWREKGVVNGALLFDGYSNYIRYDYEDIKIKGPSLSISVFVAPRAFEWDDPNAKENGSDKLTAIASQYNKDINSGFILGYHRHGEFSFQVGIGDRWLTIWDEGNPLNKYEWNHISAVFDGKNGKMSLYLNGELINEKLFFEGAEIAPAYDEPLLIGKNNYPGSNATASLNMVSGLLDELKIYNRVLNSNEISKYFNSIDLPKLEYEDIALVNILQDDYYKTQYHGGPYQHWMNEPHAPLYYNGYYHLFFQHNLFGPYFRNIGWGHLVSEDMVNWRPLKEIIMPSANTVAPDGVWSGGATYDKDGVPVLFFTAGNDSFRKDGLMSNQNIGIARPKDKNDPLLQEWVVGEELVIAQKPGQGKPGEFRDAHLFYEDDTYYLLIGSASTKPNTGGTALLYTTKDDLENWTYKGQLFEIENQPGDLGSVWELPVLLPVYNEDKSTKKYVFIISPAPADRADNDIYYWIGDFDKVNGRFIPDASFGNKPRLLDYGNNVFTGPSGFIDPKTGKAIIFSIMQDQRLPGHVASSGWANCVGLPREIYLNEDGSDLKIKPVEAIKNLIDETLIEFSNKSISEANTLLKDVKGDMLYIHVEFENVSANNFGIKVRKNDKVLEETAFYYDATTSTIGVRTGLSGAYSGNQNIAGRFYGPLSLDDNTLKMDLYLDRSLIEGFFNFDKAISARVYPDITSLGIELFEEGGVVTIKNMKVKTMRSIYE